MLNRLVRLKVYAQRSLIYYQFIQYVLIILIFLRGYEISDLSRILILIIIAILAVFIGYLDTRFKILEKEQGHFNRENAELREIRDLLREIKNCKPD